MEREGLLSSWLVPYCTKQKRANKTHTSGGPRRFRGEGRHCHGGGRGQAGIGAGSDRVGAREGSRRRELGASVLG